MVQGRRCDSSSDSGHPLRCLPYVRRGRWCVTLLFLIFEKTLVGSLKGPVTLNFSTTTGS